MKRSILTIVALLAFFALYQIEAQAQNRWGALNLDPVLILQQKILKMQILK